MTEYISVRFVTFLVCGSRATIGHSLTVYLSFRSIRFGTMLTLKGILEEWKDLYYDKKYGKVYDLWHKIGL